MNGKQERSDERQAVKDTKRVGLTSGSAPLDIDFSQLRICFRCYELYGPWKYFHGEILREQLCECIRRDPTKWRGFRRNTLVTVAWYQEALTRRWPGFDYNTVAELCKCCGAELLKSGSRWSVWFCDECKSKVIELERILEFWLIPIGRHSIMHGIFLHPSTPTTSAVVEKFMRRCHDIWRRMHWLDERMKVVLPQRLDALGFASGADPTVTDYLDALATARVDKHREFQDLYNYFMKRSGPEPV